MASNSQIVEAKMTSKGQVTIPIAIRRSLGLKAGKKVRFERAKDGSWKLPANEVNPFERWRGIGTGLARGDETIDEIVHAVREIRGHDDLN